MMKSWACGGACGSHQLLIGCIGTAIAQIVGNRAAEEIDVLLDDPDMAPQRSERDVPYVGAIDQDAPGGDLVKAGDQRAERALADAGRTDEGDELPRARCRAKGR